MVMASLSTPSDSITSLTSIFKASDSANSANSAKFHDFARTPPSHKRTYQACVPCRYRKVRCDLGPVDDPHLPPCVRCRRESKKCYFSQTRRKRKSIGGEHDVEGNEDTEDDHATRNCRRRISYASTSSNSLQAPLQAPGRSVLSPSEPRTPPTAGHNPQSPEIQQRPEPYYINTAIGNEGPEQDQELTNETAAALFQTPINTPGDALHLLLEASGRSEDLQRHQKSNQGAQRINRPNMKLSSSSGNYYFARPEPAESRADPDSLANLDPAMANDDQSDFVSDSARENLKIWNRLRFVRAGWFTAREAVSYINYFYEFLSPLTPINPPDFRLVSTDINLVDEEPILAITILTIAARYKNLTGPGGQTRSFMIHEKLWTHLQNMITRMCWGQEHFGGGFSWTGSRTSAQKAMEKGKLRSLGTIESLLLLSEFHPRSMHFPASDDGDDILAPIDGDFIVDDAHEGPSTGESMFAGWIEPALRSDRMCWSLIGTAYTLAYELGIFGNYAEGTRPIESRRNWRVEAREHRQRAHRIERLLYIYITQTSGRLGFPSAFPGYAGDTDLAKFDRDFFESGRLSSQADVEKIQQSWADITSIMKASNALLFSSKVKTTELIQSGEYIGCLKQLQPILASWQKKFQSLDVPKYSKIILSIEYEYARVYINSLALQAVLQHWTAKAGEGIRDHVANQPGTSASGYLAGSYNENDYPIKEVVDASRSLLRHVVQGLFPNGNLKHAPVRVYMRILSSAMFLLKTFALGAKEDEVAHSLNLLDGTVKALRTSVVDDVHLSLRIADLLEGLTSSIRHRFVRLAHQSSTKHTTAFPNIFRSSQAPSGTGPQAQTATGNNNNNEIDPNTISLNSYQLSRKLNIQDPIDLTDYNISIIPPRDTAYNFPLPPDPSSSSPFSAAIYNNIIHPAGPPNPYDYQQPEQQQQAYANMTNPSNPPSSSSSNPNNPNTTTTTDPTDPTDPITATNKDWITLNINPLRAADPGTAGGWMSDGADWFGGGFGPEITSNFEILGRLASEGYRSEGWDGGFSFPGWQGEGGERGGG